MADRGPAGRVMTFDLYAWKSPRDVDVARAEALLEGWPETSRDPGTSPFEPSTDVAWFYRELMEVVPGLDASSDTDSNPSATPIWLTPTSEAPARIVAMRLSAVLPHDALDSIYGLGAKYDLVLFDARSRHVHLPLEEMAAHARATFWPRGAIQAEAAGGIGGVIALVAWLLAIPILSGFFVFVGGFMVLMAVYTFVHEARRAAKSRRIGGE